MPWLLTSPGHQQPWYGLCSPGLTWGRILSTRVISIWSNDIKCKYMFMFHQENLARKGLIRYPGTWEILCFQIMTPLIHCSLVTLYGNIDLCQNWLGQWLLSDSPKPLPEPMLTSNQWGSLAFTWEQFHSECPSYYPVYWFRKLKELRNFKGLKRLIGQIIALISFVWLKGTKSFF